MAVSNPSHPVHTYIHHRVGRGKIEYEKDYATYTELIHLFGAQEQAMPLPKLRNHTHHNLPAYPSLFATSNGKANTVAPLNTNPNNTTNFGI